MKINFILFFIIIAIGFGSAFYLDKKEKMPAPKEAPVFTIEKRDGSNLSLEDFKGKKIILHFWATWCAPCLVEFPEIIDYAYKNTEHVVLAIAVQDKAPEIDVFLRKIKKELPNNFHIALDPEWRISKEFYGVHQLPESFILSPDMTIKKRLIGAQDDWDNMNLFQ